MTSRRRVVDIAAIVLALLFALFLLRAGVSPPHKRNGFDRALVKIASPIQYVFDELIGWVGGGLQHYVLLGDVEKENRELRRYAFDLETRLLAANRKLAELQGHQELAEAADLGDNTLIAKGRVFSSRLDGGSHVVRARLSYAAGVKTGDAVVASRGVDSTGLALVGRVLARHGKTIDILLTCDPSFALDVRLSPGAQRGLLRGGAHSHNHARLTWISTTSDAVSKGAEVVTSGFGRAAPAQLKVGVIDKLYRERDQVVGARVKLHRSAHTVSDIAVVTSKLSHERQRIGPL